MATTLIDKGATKVFLSGGGAAASGGTIANSEEIIKQAVELALIEINQLASKMDEDRGISNKDYESFVPDTREEVG